MRLDLDHVGRIAVAVADIGRAERTDGETPGLRRLRRFGDLGPMPEAPKGDAPR